MSDSKTPGDKIAATITEIGNSQAATGVIRESVARGPYWLRNALYIASLVVGVVLTVIPVAQAFVTGDTATALNASYGVVVALSGLFAKLNITKPTAQG